MSDEQKIRKPQQSNPLPGPDTQSDGLSPFSERRTEERLPDKSRITEERHSDSPGYERGTDPGFRNWRQQNARETEPPEARNHPRILDYSSGPAGTNEYAVMPRATLDELIALLNPAKNSVNGRAAALRNMSRFGDDVPADVLFAGLSDSQPRVRVATLETLVALLPFRPIPPSIIATFLNDSNTLVRTSAAWCLGHFGDDIPVRLLKDVLEDERDYNVRAAALLALSKSNDREVPALLTYHLKDRHHWQMREAAIEGMSDNEELLPFNKLHTIILEDENDLVRVTAIEALAGRDSSILSTVKLFKELNKDSVLAVFDDEESRQFVRDTAQGAVEAVIRRLLKRVENDQLPIASRREAILILQELKQLQRVPQHIQATFRDALWVNRETIKIEPKVLPQARPFAKLEPIDMLKHLSILIATFFMSFLRIDSSSSRYLSQGNAYQNDGIHKEYIRALLNGRTVVVPCESLYSNKAFADDFIQEGKNRPAFLHLLKEGVIVPYLHHVLRPDQQPEQNVGVLPQAFAAWLRICSEVEMSCLRLSWNVNNEHENIPLAVPFSSPANLAYAQQLARGLNCYVQSPATLPLPTLREDRSQQPEKQPHILYELRRTVSRKTFFNTDTTKDNVARLYDMRLLSMLSLADIVEIRNSEEWKTYIKKLEHITKELHDYSRVEMLPSLHMLYVKLMELITRHLGNRISKDYAPTWRPAPWLEIEIGSASINIQWWQDSTICSFSGKEQPTLLNESAPYTITFHIGQASIPGDVDDLSQAFVIARGWLANAEQEWINLRQDIIHKSTHHEKRLQPKQLAGSVLYL